MNSFLSAEEWAQAHFGDCALGDARRTQRLVQITTRLADQPGQSLHAASGGDTAFLEGAYRLLANTQIPLDAMLEPAFQRVAQGIQTGSEVVLALEDTTELSYSHGAAEELGDIGGLAKSAYRGIWAHSVLAVEASGGRVLGLLEQTRWARRSGRAPKGAHKKKPYASKESFKWQRSSERMGQRLGAEAMTAEPLHWRLLTSEPVPHVEAAQRLVGWCQRRWMVEEFHKAWKSGCGVERLRMQSAWTLERMAALLAMGMLGGQASPATGLESALDGL